MEWVSGDRVGIEWVWVKLWRSGDQEGSSRLKAEEAVCVQVTGEG